VSTFENDASFSRINLRLQLLGGNVLRALAGLRQAYGLLHRIVSFSGKEEFSSANEIYCAATYTEEFIF